MSQANSIDEANGTRKKEHAVVVPGTQRSLNASTWLAYKHAVLEAVTTTDAGEDEPVDGVSPDAGEDEPVDGVSPTAATASHPLLSSAATRRETGSFPRVPTIVVVTHCDMTLPKPQDVFHLGEHIDNSDASFKHDKLVCKHHAKETSAARALPPSSASCTCTASGVTIVDDDDEHREWASDRVSDM